MGCTASVLDHDQQQDWVHSKLQVSEKPEESQRPAYQQENSVTSHRNIDSINLEGHCDENEVLAGDIPDYASKSNESEDAMYDGSYDGYSKDFSGVGTVDAHYDDTSSESENNTTLYKSHLERYLKRGPIDTDDEDLTLLDSTIVPSEAPGPVHCDESDNGSIFGQSSCGDAVIALSVAPYGSQLERYLKHGPIDTDDEDLTLVDSTIVPSEAPGPVHCDESENGSIFGQSSSGETLIASSVAPDPLHSDDEIRHHEDQSSLSDILLEIPQRTSFSPQEHTKTQRSTRRLDISKWEAGANVKTTTSTSAAANCPKRLDTSKWETRGNPGIATVDRLNTITQQSSQQKLQTKLSPSSAAKIKLKDDIDRLREQIRQLASQKATGPTSPRRYRYVKPNDLVFSDHNPTVAQAIGTENEIHTDLCSMNAVCVCDETDESTYVENERVTTTYVEHHIRDISSAMESKEQHDHLENVGRIKEEQWMTKHVYEADAICCTRNEELLAYRRNENDEDLRDHVTPFTNSEIDHSLIDNERLEDQNIEVGAGIEKHMIISGNDVMHQSSIVNECHPGENAHSRPSTSSDEMMNDQRESLQICDRRVSFDSTDMQYSVSTSGISPDNDLNCDDEYSQLIGAFIEKPQLSEDIDDNKENVVMALLPSTTDRELFQPILKQMEDDVAQTLSLDHDSTEKSDGGLTLKSNELDRTPTTDGNVSIKLIAAATGATQGSVKHSNPVDGYEGNIDTADFVNQLNLDPWNRESQLNEQQITYMIEQNPSICSQKYIFEGFHGCIYPLSALCALGASVKLVKVCYLAFPQAITKADAWVGTSLHYACSYHAPLPIVEFLSKKHPLALKAVNQFNRLPLHMACMFDAEPNVISYLIRKYPGGCKKPDKLGLLPLHIACDSDIGVNSPNISVIKILTDSYPDACMHTSEAGTTPVAISIARRVSLSVLEILVEACPESLSVQDHKKRIPLHSAVLHKASFDLLALLVASFRSGLELTDSKNETPYACAIRLELSQHVLDLLKPIDCANSPVPVQAPMPQELHIDQ